MLKKRLFIFCKWIGGITIGLFLLITAVLYFFKDDICNLAINEANKHLNAKVQVSKVELAFWGSFPNLSIDFNNVFIQDTFENSTESDTLLFTERIRIKLNPIDVWNENYDIQEIDVSPGTINLKINEEGLSNYNILKDSTDEQSESNLEIKLQKVSFNDVRFSYINNVTNQEYRTNIKELSLNGEFSNTAYSLKAESKLNIIAAKSGNVNMVSNKNADMNFSVNVNTDSSTITIPPSTIFIAKLPFDFKGKIDSLGFNFDLHGKNIQIQELANNLFIEQTKDVKKFSGTGELLFDLKINGLNDPKIPASILCNFGIKNGTLKEPESKISISKLNIDGIYSNRGGKEKELLNLKKITFKTKGGLFAGKLKISNFKEPIYQGRADGLINLDVLHQLFHIPGVHDVSGMVDISSDYVVQARPHEGATTEYIIKKSDGKLKMKGVNIQLLNDKRIFSNITGQTYLKNNEIGLDNLTLNISKSDFKVNGVFRNLSNYFSGKGNLDANIELESKYIDLADLGTDTKEEKLEHERRFILPNDIHGDLYVKIKKLKYEKHIFSKLAGNMTLEGRTIDFPKVTFSNGGADAFGSIKIEERKPEFFYISSQLVSRNIDFKKLFKEWNNFDQDVITRENISGIAQANIKFSAPFDLRSGIISSAIDAQIGMQIDNGKLKNVTTFKAIIDGIRSSKTARMLIGSENIKSFEDKLLNLKFEQLKNTIYIKNSVLTIPNFSINSSALNIEASGKHTFDNDIDYRIGFRFRDLKAKKESEFGEIIDDETGKYIFMRMYGNLNNPIFEWDKETNKARRKENQKEAKIDAKSILKTEFGLFKNDTLVGTYIQEKQEHESIEIEYDPVNEIDTIIQVKKPKKDSKSRRWLNKLKEEAKKEKEEEFIIEEDF